MRSRYIKTVANADGWSDWFEVNRRRWDMACCDCGLVHTFQFKVIGNIVQARAKRNERATGQKRRFNNYICKKIK